MCWTIIKYHRERYILQIKSNPFRWTLMDLIQEEMVEKGQISRLLEFNGHSLRSVDQSQNFLYSTVQMCRTFEIS